MDPLDFIRISNLKSTKTKSTWEQHQAWFLFRARPRKDMKRKPENGPSSSNLNFSGLFHVRLVFESLIKTTQGHKWICGRLKHTTPWNTSRKSFQYLIYPHTKLYNTHTSEILNNLFPNVSDLKVPKLSLHPRNLTIGYTTITISKLSQFWHFPVHSNGSSRCLFRFFSLRGGLWDFHF